MTKRFLSVGGVLGLVAALAACDANPAGTGSARVRLLLTDAPGDLASAEVRIDEIYLQGGGGENEGGRLVLYSGGDSFDLLELQGGVTAELANIEIPAGTYQELRLRLGWARIETLDGRVFTTENGTLHCPSCAQSGLKIKFGGGALRLEEGEQKLIVDFDVSQSFGRERGRSGRWVMHPVITATRAEAAGSIVGTVELDEGVTLPVCGGSQTTLASFVPTATAGEVSLSGFTNEEGEFSFPYVASESYTVGYEDEVVFANGDRLLLAATPSVSSLDVATGSAATVDFTITAASCEEE